MKNIFLTIVIVFMIGFCADAQNDGFFKGFDGGSYNRSDINDVNILTPNKPLNSTENDSAPLGSGLLVMAVLGVGYAVNKGRRE